MASLGDIILLENTVQDPAAQENFRRIKVFLRDAAVLNAGFVYRTFEIPNTSEYAYKHNLTFVPKDIITTAISNDASVVWHFNKFDKNYVYLTASAPAQIRVFFGAYKDDNS